MTSTTPPSITDAYLSNLVSLPLEAKKKKIDIISRRVCGQLTEKLVRQPAKRIARHERQHAGRQAPREPSQPVPLPDDAERIHHAPRATDLQVLRAPAGLQQRLCDVQRRRHACGNRAREPARHNMCDGRVDPGRVQPLFQLLVHAELHGGKRDTHDECRRVGYVEGADALVPVYRRRTVPERSVARIVHLHSLLDHCDPRA